MKKRVSFFILLLSNLFLPQYVFAADIDVERTFMWIYRATDFVVQIIIVISLVFFFWSLIRLLLARDDQELKIHIYHNMLNSIIVFISTVAIWIVFTFMVKYFNFEALSPIANLLFKT